MIYNCLNIQLDGLANGLPPLQPKQWIDQEQELILLDVRIPQKVEAIWLIDDCVMHIPLGQLRERADELPKDKDIQPSARKACGAVRPSAFCRGLALSGYGSPKEAL